MLAASAAALTAAFVTKIRFGKPDASLTANGWVGGLVASSASCAFVSPAEAVVIGSISGVMITFSIEWLELRMEVDDPAAPFPCTPSEACGASSQWGFSANFSGRS